MKRTKLRIFVLEDEIDKAPREQIKEVLAKHDVHYARNIKEAMEKFSGEYDLMLLDHDMEGHYEAINHPNTGSAFLRWLFDEKEWKPKTKPQVVLHSQNTSARQHMAGLLKSYKFTNVDECAFGPAYIKLLKEQIG